LEAAVASGANAFGTPEVHLSKFYIFDIFIILFFDNHRLGFIKQRTAFHFKFMVNKAPILTNMAMTLEMGNQMTLSNSKIYV